MKRRIGLIAIVVAMLGLSACASLSESRNRAQKAHACATIKNLTMAVELYYVDNGRYPPSLDALIGQPGGDSRHGPYVTGERLPADAWGTPFQYRLSEGVPAIVSAGPDTTFGTGDDIDVRCR